MFQNLLVLPVRYIQLSSSLICSLYTLRFILRETILCSLVPNSELVLTLLTRRLFLLNIAIRIAMDNYE